MVKHQQFVLSSSTCLIHGVGQKVPRDFEVALGLVPIVSFGSNMVVDHHTTSSFLSHLSFFVVA